MLILESSNGSFETAALNLSYSSHNSLAPLRSNDRLLHSKSNVEENDDYLPKPVFKHKRVVSNPFDILYSDNNSPKPNSNLSNEIQTSPREPYTPLHTNRQNLYTPKNIYTPEHIISPTKGLRREIASSPPIITMIDRSSLNRSSSVISREASLKNRFNLAKRNKMINKKSLEINSPVYDSDSIYDSDYKNHQNRRKPGNWNRNLRFLFPVKRRTSFKRKSAYHLLRESKGKTPNFHTRQELEHFLIQTNAQQLMKELIPNKMKLFNYPLLDLLTRKPNPVDTTRHFRIHENRFSIVSPNEPKLISPPFKDSFFKNGQPVYNTDKPREFDLNEAIYTRYRNKVLHGSFQIPPKFTDYFPDERDNNLLTATDIDQMNKKILLEVLLRRTLAAKIDYRLKQNGYYNKDKSDQQTSTEQDTDSSDDDDDRGNIRHSHVPKLVHTDSDDSPDDESVNTDDLMQQNQSLYSGLLPSPQISYKSNIFGSDFKIQSETFKDYDDELSSRNPRNGTKLRRTASTNDLLNLVRHVTPPEPVADPHSPFNTSVFNIKRNPRRDSANRRRDEELSVLERALGKPQFNYELMPINRSVETFSSSSESGVLSRTPPGLSKNNSLKSFGSNMSIRRSGSLNMDKSKRESNATTTTGPSDFEPSHNRKSQSTSGTSIFQDLDDLSSELSMFIQNPEPEHKIIQYPTQPPRFVHRNIVTDEDPLFVKQHEPTRLSYQDILDTVKMSGSNINIAPSPSTGPSHSKAVNQAPEVVSMQGSISVVGSDTATNYSSHNSFRSNLPRFRVHQSKRQNNNN